MRTIRCSSRLLGWLSAREGVSAQGGVWLGVSAQVGGIPACTEADTPPWTDFLTHACENITLPQLRCGREKSYRSHIRQLQCSPHQRKRDGLIRTSNGVDERRNWTVSKSLWTNRTQEGPMLNSPCSLVHQSTTRWRRQRWPQPPGGSKRFLFHCESKNRNWFILVILVLFKAKEIF